MLSVVFQMMFAHDAYLEGKHQIPRTVMCQTNNTFIQSEAVFWLAQTPLYQYTPLQVLPEQDNYVQWIFTD